MSLFNTQVVQADLSLLVREFQRLNSNLEQIFQINSPEVEPGRDFDPDDYSSVMYSNEEDELIKQHVSKVIPGGHVRG